MNLPVWSHDLLDNLNPTRRGRHSIHHLLGLQLDDLGLHNHLLLLLGWLLLHLHLGLVGLRLLFRLLLLRLLLRRLHIVRDLLGHPD